MASAAATLFSRSPVTFILHRLASVFTSYSSPILTFREALAWEPSNLTFPLSQAVAAIDLVLNKRIAQRYLSRRSFSLTGIFKNKKSQPDDWDLNFFNESLIHFSKILMEIRDCLYSFIIILNIVLLIRAMQVVIIKAKAHENYFNA